MFITAPVLALFDAERETIAEVDASKWCVGGTLYQVDDEGVIRPCAFFSKKNSPAECNYEIYDKEMLAIVRCLEEWDAELRSVKEFEIRSDHKNLEYFMTVRKLTERQMRWSLILSRYNFKISYVKGKDNERADALSRREQDLPDGEDDNRLQYRMTQLLKPGMVKGKTGILYAAPVATGEEPPTGDAATTIDQLWAAAEQVDNIYQGAAEAVRRGARSFPTTFGLKVLIAEYNLDSEG